MSAASIDVARQHAWRAPDLRLTPTLLYEQTAAEDVVASGASFDAVLALEIIEHVSSASTFLTQVSQLVRPGGILVISTINRTPLSYALAIVAAERLLGWLPVGTHDWSRFVTPGEVSAMLARDTGLETLEVLGVRFNPISASFSLVDDVSVNYILTAVKPLRESSPVENADVIPDANSGSKADEKTIGTAQPR